MSDLRLMNQVDDCCGGECLVYSLETQTYEQITETWGEIHDDGGFGTPGPDGQFVLGVTYPSTDPAAILDITGTEYAVSLVISFGANSTSTVTITLEDPLATNPIVITIDYDDDYPATGGTFRAALISVFSESMVVPLYTADVELQICRTESNLTINAGRPDDPSPHPNRSIDAALSVAPTSSEIIIAGDGSTSITISSLNVTKPDGSLECPHCNQCDAWPCADKEPGEIIEFSFELISEISADPGYTCTEPEATYVDQTGLTNSPYSVYMDDPYKDGDASDIRVVSVDQIAASQLLELSTCVRFGGNRDIFVNNAYTFGDFVFEISVDPETCEYQYNAELVVTFFHGPTGSIIGGSYPITPSPNYSGTKRYFWSGTLPGRPNCCDIYQFDFADADSVSQISGADFPLSISRLELTGFQVYCT